MRWPTDLRFGSPGTVTFCDGCGTFCDAACRAARRRDDTLLRGLLRAVPYSGGLVR